ncbi:MAG: desulforedoxin [Candidatus Omnitrophota bacterium]|nr:MAG: desulforedoxin [Candidatus Omnitrophota bacterium]
MAKLRKGQKMVCVPCGREVVVSSGGISSATIWCCGKPMRKGKQALKKKK